MVDRMRLCRKNEMRCTSDVCIFTGTSFYAVPRASICSFRNDHGVVVAQLQRSCWRLSPSQHATPGPRSQG